jgi:hypothetical protein
MSGKMNGVPISSVDLRRRYIRLGADDIKPAVKKSAKKAKSEKK